MTVILKRIPDARISSVRAYFRAGSIYEDDFLGTGISHLIEHMLFKGTDKFKMGEISRTMQALGGQENAYTSFENVCYHATVPSENTARALSIIANAVFHPTLDSMEFEKERKVVLNELKMGEDDIDRSLSQLFFRETYLRLPYRYPVIGLEKLLMGLSREDLLAYHHKRFVPANAVFVCVGNFDREEVLKAIFQESDRLVHRSSPDSPIPEEPSQLAFKYVEQRRDDAVTSRVIAGFKTVRLLNEDLFALDVLSSMLGGGESSVLNRILRKEKGLVQEVSAFSFTPAYQGVFGVSMTLKDENYAKATNVLFAILEKVPRYLAKEDLERVKNQVLADAIANLQTVEGQASQLGNDFINTGDIGFSESYAQSVSQLTLKDLQRVWAKYYNKNRITMTAIRPKLIPQVSSTDVFSQDPQLKVDRHVLRNGLRVLFIEKKGLPLVNMKFLTAGGLLLDNKPGIGKFVNEMLVKGSRKYPGLSQYSKIERVGGWIANYYGNNSAGLTVNVLEKDVSLGIDLLFDALQNPSFDPKEIRQLKIETLQQIRNQEEDIFTQGINQIKGLFFGQHPYAFSRLGTTSSVSQFTRKDLLDYHKSNYNASNSVLVVVGDLPNAKKQFILKKFSSLRKGACRLSNAPEVSPPQENSVVVRTNNKNRSLVLLAYPIPSLLSDGRYPIEVLDSVISGLGSRLFYQLRDVEHLGYTVGSSPILLLKEGMLLFYIGTSRPLLAQAQTGLFREISRFSTISNEEIASAQRSLISDYRKRAQSYDSLALDAGLYELYYNAIDRYAAYETDIKQVTQEDVLRQVRSVFSKPYALVVLEGRADEK